MASIQEAVANARTGRGGVILLEGRAGFGKTRLLEEALRLAGDARMQTASGQADLDDTSVPMAPLLAALRGGRRPVLDRTQLSRLRAATADRYWALLELEEMLEQAAHDAPLLVCLDDVHWADPGTIDALRSLPVRLAGLPIVWLIAYRRQQRSTAMMRMLGELVDAKATRLSLGALGKDAVGALVRDLTHGEADTGLLALTATAHGVPFFLIELLRGLLDEGLVRIEDGRTTLLEVRLPARVRDSMKERLGHLSAHGRQAVIAASVLGRSFRFEDLASMLAVPAAALLALVEELDGAEFLTDSGARLSFRHDIVRQAVLDSVPAAARRALDRQAAEILLASGALPLEIASRIAASAELGDDVAVTTLAEATHALAQTDPGTASAFARKALELTMPGDPRRAALAAETVVLLHAAGRAAEAGEFADGILGQILPAEAEAQVRLSIAQMYSLPADLRIDNGRAALALTDVSAPLRARHLAVQVLSLVAASKPREARTSAAVAQAAVDATGDELARLNLEFGRLAIDEATYDYPSMIGRIQAVHQLGSEVGDNTQVQAAEWFRSNLLVSLGRFDEALGVVQSGLDAARRDHQAWIAPRLDLWRGWILLQRGRLNDAGAVLEGALAAAGIDLTLAIPDAAGLLALGQVALHTGDQRLSRRCADIAHTTLAVGAFDDARRHVLWLVALQAMARGDAPAGRAALMADRDSEGVLPVLAREVGAEVQLLRLALAAGDAELAQTAVREATERARLNPGTVGIVAVSAHARGLHDQDLTELQTAVGLFENQSRPLLLASALEDLGVACTSQGRSDDAVQALDRALEHYNASGATWDARRTRSRLRTLGVRHRAFSPERPLTGWEALTDSELEVARLVASGLTNAESAERLFVSPHTVGTHLRHIFAKLQINSRMELARIALRHDERG